MNEQIYLTVSPTVERLVSWTHHETVIIANDLTFKDLLDTLHCKAAEEWKITLTFDPTYLQDWIKRAKADYPKLTIDNPYFEELLEIANGADECWEIEYFRLFEETLLEDEYLPQPKGEPHNGQEIRP